MNKYYYEHTRHCKQRYTHVKLRM